MKWEVHPIAEFSNYAESWDNLNREYLNSLFFDLRFFEPVLKFFASGREYLAVLKENNQVKGLIVLEKLPYGRWQTFQPSQSPISFCLIPPELFNERTIDGLSSALPGFVLSVGFTQLDPRFYERPPQTQKLKTLDYITTGRLGVPGDFDKYWADRSRNVKQNFNRARNRLSKQDIEVFFNVMSKKDDIAESVGIYGDIESVSWKAESGTAVSRTNQQGEFYTELMSGFTPDGAEVWQYLYNEEVVATDLCIKNASEIIILKTTFIDEWNKFSPAFSMHIEGIKHLVKTGIENIEFYGPAMDWHKKLTDELRTMYHLTWCKYPMILALRSQFVKLKLLLQ